MTLETEFKVGDIVQLKSGGPLMTVGYADAATGRVTCMWMDADGNLKDYEFERATIKRIPQDGE